jgi:hypothetical protein
MPRPKDPIAKGSQFHSRVTPGEAAAIGEIVKRRAAQAVAKNPTAKYDRTTWFRDFVRKEAKSLGIEIVEPTAPVGEGGEEAGETSARTLTTP